MNTAIAAAALVLLALAFAWAKREKRSPLLSPEAPELDEDLVRALINGPRRDGARQRL